MVQADGSFRSELCSFMLRKREELASSSTQDYRTAGLDSDCRRKLEKMRDIADNSMDSSDNGPQDVFTYNDVLDSNVRIEISHASGELDDLQDDLNQELNGKKQQSFRRRQDTRKCWDTVDRRVLGFRGQMCAMTNAYMKWEATQGAFGMEGAPEPVVDPEDVEKEYRVNVINVFGTYTVDIPMVQLDEFIASCLIGQGLIPCAPWKPTLAIAARVLELYRVARLCCPNLSVQSWVKTLSDVQARAFKPYQVQQFTICFDLYLEMLQNVDAQVKKALGRDAPDWRVKNCCPACTYKLEGEDKLIFEMVATCDGNDSLKRVLRKEQGAFDESGVAKRSGMERPDPRAANAGWDYYLTQERVNKWSKEVLAQQVQVPRSDDPEEDNLCQERWKNMSEEIAERMWGIFDETGIFLSLCHHGFVLLIADMVRSGELAKYGLAIADALMDAFGEDTGSGYDIGCRFGTTIRNSPLGPKAKRLNFWMLVGSFHGHCQKNPRKPINRYQALSGFKARAFLS
ncbi:hypothetical protein B0H17DRAFT_1136116 [Mycena rosella]|uniref:CxC1-like cysteine cluster associated with KDZ transposases domain-containing protein n=1 Tax=Mycena rosella TaxID=1033263 RepID=A0AAD7DC38_MYCRO|nr:hypothetical protein B0H17DRAFT_1136116 [Mycena rosella]